MTSRPRLIAAVRPDRFIWAREGLRIADRAGLKLSDLTGRDRTRRTTIPRAELATAMHRNGMSLPVIGRLLGGRDHTTILHLVRRHEAGLYKPCRPCIE
jgi:chromosomal replication initiator protein